MNVKLDISKALKANYGGRAQLPEEHFYEMGLDAPEKVDYKVMDDAIESAIEWIWKASRGVYHA
jgi:hypothetical protein